MHRDVRRYRIRLSFTQILKGRVVNDTGNRVAQVAHDFVETAVLELAAGLDVFCSDAADRREAAFECPYDVAESDLCGRPGKGVTAVHPHFALDIACVLEGEKDLLEVLSRDPLTFRDRTRRDDTALVIGQGQLDHSAQRIIGPLR